MNRFWGVAIVLVLVVTVVIAGAATWFWATIPPTPDPNELPSSVLEPPSAAYGDAVEEGRSTARALVADEKLPGLSLAVAVDGELVWAEGFRWADMESETPVTPETLFRIGGISETLTAAAAGLLAGRGRLDLDAPVRRYLPAFPEMRWPVTTRELMAHMGGIRPHRGEDGIFRGAGCADNVERLAFFSDDTLRYRPGTRRAYSPSGWVLAGAVVAAAADEPYLDVMEREILEPLSMEHTMPDGDGLTVPARARFYYPRAMLDPRYGLQDAPTMDLSCYLPAVGFLSTPSDLVRFGSAMMDGGFLEPAVREELWTPVRPASGDSTEQALGWTVLRAPMGAGDAATRIVGRGLGKAARRGRLGAANAGGQIAGGTATLLIVPEYGIVVAVASNVSGAENVPLLAYRLAEVFARARETR